MNGIWEHSVIVSQNLHFHHEIHPRCYVLPYKVKVIMDAEDQK